MFPRDPNAARQFGVLPPEPNIVDSILRGADSVGQATQPALNFVGRALQKFDELFTFPTQKYQPDDPHQLPIHHQYPPDPRANESTGPIGDYVKNAMKLYSGFEGASSDNPFGGRMGLGSFPILGSVIRPVDLNLRNTLLKNPELREKYNQYYGRILPGRLWERNIEDAPGAIAHRTQPYTNEYGFSSSPRYGTYYGHGDEGPLMAAMYARPMDLPGARTGGPNPVTERLKIRNPFMLHLMDENFTVPSSTGYFGEAIVPPAWPSNVALAKMMGPKDYGRLLDDVSYIAGEGQRLNQAQQNNLTNILKRVGLERKQAQEVSSYFENHGYLNYQVLDAIANKKMLDLGRDYLVANKSRGPVGGIAHEVMQLSGVPNPTRNEIVRLGRGNAWNRLEDLQLDTLPEDFRQVLRDTAAERAKLKGRIK